MALLKPLALASALVVAVPVTATTAGPDEEIVVTGKALSPAEARRQAAEFVDRVGVAAGHVPAARFLDPVCPRVFGLDRTRAGQVEQRLRAHAAAVGAKLGKLGCTANLAVIFTADAGSMVKKIAGRSTETLGELAPADRAALVAGDAPVRWWYDTEARGKDGQREIGMPFLAGGTTEGGAPLVPGGGTYLQYRSSLVSTLSVRAIRSATVIVDVERASGVPLTAVGDYAAMVGLAEVRQRTALAGSILALFDRRQPVRELSDRDRAFLCGLYAMPLDRLARQHRQLLVARMLDPARD
jgi:hypothetical protein